jgi:hypothetical protein
MKYIFMTMTEGVGSQQRVENENTRTKLTLKRQGYQSDTIPLVLVPDNTVDYHSCPS